MTTPGTAILIPVLRRPHRVAALVDNITAVTPEPHHVMFVTSPDDHEEHKAIADAGADQLTLEQPPGPGDYPRKINAAFDGTSEPFVFLGADDLHFRPGWLAAALDRMDEPQIGVVGTQDLGNPRVIAGKHATHSLVRRSYVDRFGTIDERGKVLHDGYDHNFCDNELVETARKRRAWVFAHDSIVEHNHPSWGKADMDATYRRGRAGFNRDRRLYVQRSRLWT